jgi:3',5'-cyclic AMP phosphodiesterase CpdA
LEQRQSTLVRGGSLREDQDRTAVLRELKAPLLTLPGNHDILPQRLDTTLTAWREKVGDLLTVSAPLSIRTSCRLY